MPGMGVTIAGIAGMSLAASTIVAVHPGQSVQLAGYDWTLLALARRAGAELHGARRRHPCEPRRRARSRCSIRPAGFHGQKTDGHRHRDPHQRPRDLYAVLGEERDGAAVLRLHYNPLAPWIWFGALVMAAGARCRSPTGGCASARRHGVPVGAGAGCA